MPRPKNEGRENEGVSEVVGTMILIGVVMVGMVFAGVFLLSTPTASKVPVFDAIISNQSNTVYIYHKGGDPLYKGQYQILVDGVDRTSSFTNSGGLGPTDLNWSVGETLSATISPMPSHVVIVFNPTGGGASGGGTSGGASVLTESDLTPLQKVLSRPLNPAPSVIWSSSPAFRNATYPFQFTDSSSGTNITYYYWDFHDQNHSFDPSPVHTFPCNPSPGQDLCLYDIDHVVTDSNGTDWEVSSSLNRSAYLPVFRNLSPTVTFTQDTTSVPKCYSVNFQGTQFGSINVDSWSWTFGDGGTDTGQFPTAHTYTTAGTYTVTLTATNFTLGQNITTKNNLIQVTSGSWYNCNWLYRKSITIDHTKVQNTDQSNFPVLINLTSDSDLEAHARTNGFDILFIDSDGTTKLSHQIEYYNSAYGGLVAWVKIPTLSHSTDTSIYMYYGYGSSPRQETVTGVWSNGYLSVWHLNQTIGGTRALLDSTSTNNHGTDQNTPTLGAAGKIGYGVSLDGSQSEYISTRYSYDDPTTFTASLWFKTSSSTPRKMFGFETDQTGQSSTHWDRHLYIGQGGIVVAGVYGGSTTTVSTSSNEADGNWHYAVMTFASNTLKLYVDNSYIGQASGSAEDVQSYWRMGSYRLTGWPYITGGGDGYFTGSLDEVRVSITTARSSDWVLTEYNNQNTPGVGGFLKSLGTQETWT